MPTYDYRCNACSHEFEEFQSMTAKPLKTCPECGEKSLQRLIGTGAGLIFKGSGFYETDYRSESYKKAAKAEADSSSDKKSDSQGENKSNTKSDSKPDKKTNDKPTSATESKPASKTAPSKA